MSGDDDERRKRFERFEAFEEWERRQPKRAARERPTLELWDEYIPSLRPGSGLAKNRPGMRRFLLIPFSLAGEQVTMGGLRPSQVDEKAFKAWVAAIYATPTNRRAPPTPGRVENIRIAVQACYAFHSKELGGQNPLQGFDKQPGWDKRRKGYYTPEELERFAQAMPPMGGDIMRVLFWTLQRLDTIRCLRKDQVDWKTRDLTLLVKGTREERVPCEDGAFEIIQRWAAVSRSEYVFPNPRDPLGRPLPYPTFRKQQIRAEKTTGMRLQGEAPRSHAARHGGARHLLPTTPLPLISKQLTHRDLKTTGIYLGVSNQLHEVLRGCLNDAAKRAK